MQLKVTLDLYSGRPNPSIILTGAAARKAAGRLQPVRKLTADEVKSRPLPASTLGYRGLVIEEHHHHHYASGASTDPLMFYMLMNMASQPHYVPAPIIYDAPPHHRRDPDPTPSPSYDPPSSPSYDSGGGGSSFDSGISSSDSSGGGGSW